MNSTVSYRTEFESCYVQDEELHAHRYRIEVTVDGPQRYVDFGQMIMRILKEQISHGAWFGRSINVRSMQVHGDHEPGVRVIEVKLRETNDSFATWSI